MYHLKPSLLVPAKILAPPSGTVIESFENTPFTGSGDVATWMENGTATWARTTSNVTQGTYSWRCQVPQFDSQNLSNSAYPLDLSAYTELSLDVYITSMVGANDFFIIALFDGSVFATALTPPGTTGSFTTTIVFADFPGFDPSNCLLLLGRDGSDFEAAEFYVDNLRAV